MVPFEFRPLTRVFFGTGAIDRLGRAAREIGARRVLLVSDPGVTLAGHAAAAQTLLETAGVEVFLFQAFGPNPDTAMVEAGRAFAAPLGVDTIVGVGGGSSLDCAKGINFLLTNGGVMADYRGYGKAKTPLLPMIGVPTTAGTGSEAQSYAVIADAETHIKMACGDPSAAFRVALLDPSLTLSAPREVTAIAGFDAVAHAVETAVTTKRTPLSDGFAHQAWRLLAGAYERVLSQPHDFEVRSAMQVGAFLAGMAIEQSMLGATHAGSGCARRPARSAGKNWRADDAAVRGWSRRSRAADARVARGAPVDRRRQPAAVRRRGGTGNLSRGVLSAPPNGAH